MTIRIFLCAMGMAGAIFAGSWEAAAQDSKIYNSKKSSYSQGTAPKPLYNSGSSGGAKPLSLQQMLENRATSGSRSRPTTAPYVQRSQRAHGTMGLSPDEVTRIRAERDAAAERQRQQTLSGLRQSAGQNSDSFSARAQAERDTYLQQFQTPQTAPKDTRKQVYQGRERDVVQPTRIFNTIR